MNLSDKHKAEISAKLPPIDSRFLVATQTGFGVAKYDMNNGARLHVSLVCLRDAFRRIEMAQTALYKSYESYVWHREESSADAKTKEFWANYFGKFYADYVFLLLYAVAEDIASFILDFASIRNDFNVWLCDEATLKAQEKKRVSSLQAKVGIFMNERFNSHEITRHVLRLRDDAGWNTAMNYRNTWVHDKPPILNVFGSEYNRENRVEVGEGYVSFPIGSGSQAAKNVEDIMEDAKSATWICAEVLSELLSILIRKREEIGEKLDFDSGKITSSLT